MAEKREHPEHEHEKAEVERIKTAREILEEKLQRMKTEAPVAEQALKEAADRAPAGPAVTAEARAAAAAAAAPGAAPAATVDERVARAEKERDDYKNEALRARADLDNYQKRIRREMEDIRQYAAAGVLTDLIQALDNLDFSIAAAKQKPELDLFMQGVEMVRATLEKILEDRGAARVPAANVPFDPRRHEAVLVEERGDLPDGTATQELRRGYAMKDRVLRPAQVKVSRAPAPKPQNP
jgi:molecular chaperone GrpE